MIASCASGIFTFIRICLRVAPNDAAASTVFGSTLRDAALDQPDDDRERVEDAGDHARNDRDGHQVDEAG